MVLSFSNPTMEVAWLAWRQGKACVKPHKLSTQTRAHLESSFKGGGPDIIHLPIPYQVRSPEDAPKFLWHLPWTLLRTPRTSCYILLLL